MQEPKWAQKCKLSVAKIINTRREHMYGNRKWTLKLKKVSTELQQCLKSIILIYICHSCTHILLFMRFFFFPIICIFFANPSYAICLNSSITTHSLTGGHKTIQNWTKWFTTALHNGNMNFLCCVFCFSILLLFLLLSFCPFLLNWTKVLWLKWFSAEPFYCSWLLPRVKPTACK